MNCDKMDKASLSSGTSTENFEAVPNILLEEIRVELQQTDRQVPNFLRWLLECVESSNSIQQAGLVKQIGKTLQKSCSSSSAAHQVVLCGKVLVHLYLNAEGSQVIKRAIASTLQALPQQFQLKVAEHLKSVLQEIISKSSKGDFGDKRHLVDNITSCLDNFQLGTRCISEMDVIVLKFLRSTLEIFAERLQNEHCPTVVQKVCLDCQATVRALTLLLQKAEKGGFQLEINHQLLGSFIDTAVPLLISEEISLDCRCNSGMALTLLTRLYADRDEIRWLYSLIFSKIVIPHPKSPNENGWLLSQTSYEVLSELNSTSILCVVLGILSTFDEQHLTMKMDDVSGDILFFDIIFPCIIATTKEAKDASLTIINSRAVLMWTKRAKEVLQNSPSQPLFVNRLRADGEICRQLLEYIWTHWEHFIDCVRHGTKDIFDNIIAIHMLITDNAAESQFIRWLISSFLTLPWHHRGKYGALCCLVRQFGARRMLKLQPNLPEDLLNIMSENAMQSYASELFETLFVAHKNEMRSSDEEEEWSSTWVMSVIKHFNSHSHTTSLEHILSKLLQCYPSSLNYIVSKLVAADSDSINDGHLRALILTSKTARSLGIIALRSSIDEDLPASPSDTWNCFFPVHVLERALCHFDDDIRLDAFTLLCDHPKTTEVITQKDLNLIFQFLQFNMANQSPKFRQKLLAQMKKIIARICDSAQNLKRQLNFIEKKDSSSEEKRQCVENLSIYQQFIRRLFEHQLDSLYNCANFPRRGVALGIIKLLHEAIGFHVRKDIGIDLQSCLTPYNVQTLLECLKDSYEANKIIALSILKDMSSSQLAFDDYNRVAELFETALQLSSSIRPQDGLTAAYLLRLLANHRLTLQVATSMKRLFENGEPENGRLTSSSYEDSAVQHDHCSSVFSVLEILISQLTVELSIAKESLLEAAVNGPMHGVILCIRYLLMDLDFRKPLCTQEKWQCLLSKIVDICLDICTVIKPIVNNASPEGYLPPESNTDALLAQNFLRYYLTGRAEVESRQSRSGVQAKSVTSQMILLCGWRAMKEVSLLLGDICQQSIYILTDTPLTPDSPRLLMVDQILQVGDFFITLLAETIHRGAFEQAYMGFKKLCDSLSKSSVLVLYRLPEQWLSELFEHIQSGTRGDSILCSTRRSAGIPFMVQALVSSSADSQGSNCFKKAMTTLLHIGLSASNYEERSKVHAFNVLRALYRDTRLGEDVTPYVADGLQAAILGFKAKSWAVKNSATLLFSSLVTRIFGVKRGKDELSKKNCMTGNVFFQRYPILYLFFLNELKAANDSLNSSSSFIIPSLYPVLLVLARLYPSSMEGALTTLKLTSFVPFVMNCCRSRVFKKRVLAARALVPLVPLEEMVTIVTKLLQSLPNSPEEPHNHNTIHGTILQLCNLLEETANMNFPNSEHNSLKGVVLKNIIDKQWLCTNQNVCSVTRTSFLQLIDIALASKFIVENDDFPFQTQIVNLETELLNKTFNFWPPAYEMLLTETAKLYLRLHLVQCASENENETAMKRLQHCLLVLLQHWSYEVRLAILRFLYTIMDNSQSNNLSFEAASKTSEFDDVQDLATNIPIKEWKIPNCRVWIETAIGSEELINSLLSMISSELHPECLAQLCYLLPTIDNIFKHDWYESTSAVVRKTASEKMDLILQKGGCEPRDDVRCALLHLLSYLIPNVYEELKQIASIPRRPSICENVSPPINPRLVMNEWMDAFLICCAPEQSIRLRLGSTKLIVRNSYLLVDPHKCLGPNSSTIWSAAISLLQDDEPYIRYSAAKIVEVFTDTECSIQPEIALDVVLRHFVKQFGRLDKSTCANMLLDWMLKQESVRGAAISNEVDDEGRMFDRGQMNIYFEEIHLSSIVRQHLASLLCIKNGDDGTQQESRNRGSSGNDSRAAQRSLDVIKSTAVETEHSLQSMFNLKDIQAMVLEELLLAVEDLEVVTNQTPFGSFNFYNSVARLFRVINVVLCVCKYDDSQRHLLQNSRCMLMEKLISAPFYNRMLHQVAHNLNKLYLRLM